MLRYSPAPVEVMRRNVETDTLEEPVLTGEWAPREEPKRVYVWGFVAKPAPYDCDDYMTVAELLAAAGGYGYCEKCLRNIPIERHPSSRWPPTIYRGRLVLKLPANKSEWSQFLLLPGDFVLFHHIGLSL